MCGFIGTTAQHPNPEVHCSVLAHRGPDYQGWWQDETITLWHTRLAIIDLHAHAHQPFHDALTGNRIVFNGEIYNFKQLKAQFPTLPWQTESDTEVIARLYAHLGEAFIEHLEGIFAIVIYDVRAKVLHLFRDHFGIKPLFYHLHDGGISFASEIKGIRALHPTPLNPESIAHYLHSGHLAYNEATWFLGVLSLPAAHHMRFNLRDHTWTLTPYWELDPTPLHLSYEEAKEEAHHLLLRSARLNLLSDVPLGLSLSSGTDSTLLLHILKAHHQGTFNAFTFGFNERDYDEVQRVLTNPHLNDAALLHFI